MSATVAESTLRLSIAEHHLAAVRAHAADAFPEECCGFLFGRAAADGGASVEAVLPAKNEAPEHRASRFLISPEKVLRARRRARGLGLEVIGYYHSHPDGTAAPSAHDFEDAWPATSYLIVPVAEGAPGPPRSWRLRDDRGGFVEERIVPTPREPKR